MSRLAGKVAVVTGAASGIGRSISERFVAEGASVVGGDIDVAGLDARAADLSDAFVGARCDVTAEDDVAALFALAAERFGGNDIVVANAGKGHYAPLADHTLDDWRQIIDLCVTGVFLTLKYAARTTNDNGSVMVISSLNGIQPSAGMAAYCTAKAGVAMMTRVAAMELGPRGIRVNAIAPGLVETAATAPMFMVPEVVDQFVENSTLGRFAHPDEIANVAAFLASDESAFMSASFLSVDRGGNTGRYPDLPGIFSRLGG